MRKKEEFLFGSYRSPAGLLNAPIGTVEHVELRRVAQTYSTCKT
jgi:hypothetical protein